MKRAHPLRLPAVLAATLGILAACDVSDSPDRTGGTVATTFAPRILAPAEGVRQATFVVLNVWSSPNNDNKWDSVYQEDLISTFEKSIEVKNVPLRTALKFRLAGYVVSFPNGVKTVDTVWTAVKENFSLSTTTPQTQSTTILAKNWAVAPVPPYAATTVLKPGSPVVLKTTKGQRIVVSSSASVSCQGTTPADTTVQVVPLLDTSLSTWVWTCSDDPAVLPSSPRFFRWSVDTSGIAADRTPFAPIPTSFAGFADLSRITALEVDPTQSVDFGTSSALALAWNLAISPETTTPQASDFPSPPRSRQTAQHDTTGAKLSLWQSLKDTLADFPGRMRVLATVVRTDTSLGQEWISPPTRFWFNLAPPPAPRFTLVQAGWDSVRIDWDLSREDLQYRAYRHAGSEDFDTTNGDRLLDAQLKAATTGIGALPSSSPVSVKLVVVDPRTGLSTLVLLTTSTRSLPTLPVPTMIAPSAANPVVLKQSNQGSTLVTVASDSAGKPLTFLFASTEVDTADVPDPANLEWPSVTSPGARASTDGSIVTNGLPGQYVVLSIAATDSQGRISAPLKRLFKIVANNAEVMPDPPTGLRLARRDTSALDFQWNATAGFRYRVRYDLNGRGPDSSDVDADSFRLAGLSPGDTATSITVRAIDKTDPQKISAYSQSLAMAITRRPPSRPDQPRASWSTESGPLKLRFTWTRTAGNSDEYALADVKGIGELPLSSAWTARNKSTPGADTLEIPYSEVQAYPFAAFGIRAIADSMQSPPSWVVVPIPRLAPAFDPNAVAWQKGDTVRISFATNGAEAAFQLKAKVIRGTTAETTLVVTSIPGNLPLGSFKAGSISGLFWWERREPTGVALFDAGPVGRIEKQILSAPTGFRLLPRGSDNQWIFQAPPTLAPLAIPHLVVRSAGKVGISSIMDGDSIMSLLADKDTFQLVQVLGRDTSFPTIRQTLSLIESAPIANPPPGAYLFRFPIELTPPFGTGATVQVRQSKAEWRDYQVPFDPLEMANPETRLVAPFAVGSIEPLEYAQDSTFKQPDWEKRVLRGNETPIGNDWIGVSDAAIYWVGADLRNNPAYIKLSQLSLTGPGIVGFATNLTKGASMDASEMAGATVGIRGASGKEFHLVIGHGSKLEIPMIFVPTTLSATGSTQKTFVADFFPATTEPQPFYRDAKGNAFPVTAAQMSTVLSSATWIGFSVRSTATLLGSVEITSIHLVPKKPRF